MTKELNVACSCGRDPQPKFKNLKKCKTVSCKCPMMYPPTKKFKYSKRTLMLSIPRVRHERHVFQEHGMHRREIEIVREPKISTRLDQLSIKPVRNLIAVRDSVKRSVPFYYFLRFNKAIRKSMYTVYSRLANSKMPVLPKEKKLWTQADWDKFKKWAEDKAKPKKVFKPPPIKRQRKPLEELERIDILAQPKFVVEKYKRPHTLFHQPIRPISKSAQKYEITENIRKLATPKFPREKGVFSTDSLKISRGALRYKISDRVKTLAEPRIKQAVEADVKENPFQVSPNALKARATERIIELAKPKNPV